MQTPALLTSVIAPSFPVTVTRTTRPLAALPTPAHGDTTSIRLVNSVSPLRQWPQANLPHSNRLFGSAQPCGCSAVLFH
ncbi:hypothetical protein K443DRAFT_477986 [Laccaria amethystina LaAM-08-1]|uniref:Uncharacterized protein n=1 Tax=Laccaria amethystina LaAM-08-1 TaxID=1095629 RepID=A0A0C9WTI0_9AGAR|nr:hypothetical protein K443DRAFT_477986 [Laccaria amethystina LaAM-08-1]